MIRVRAVRTVEAMNDTSEPAKQPGDRDPEHPETVDEPVLDGATEHDPEDENVDPRKGLTDPALIRDIDADKKTANPYG